MKIILPNGHLKFETMKVIEENKRKTVKTILSANRCAPNDILTKGGEIMDIVE